MSGRLRRKATPPRSPARSPGCRRSSSPPVPSLDRNLGEIVEHRRRALVVAADTALRPLLAAGVQPDLVVGVDPSEANARHLTDLSSCPGTWLVAEGSLDPVALATLRGPHVRLPRRESSSMALAAEPRPRSRPAPRLGIGADDGVRSDAGDGLRSDCVRGRGPGVHRRPAIRARDDLRSRLAPRRGVGRDARRHLGLPNRRVARNDRRRRRRHAGADRAAPAIVPRLDRSRSRKGNGSRHRQRHRRAAFSSEKACGRIRSPARWPDDGDRTRSRPRSRACTPHRRAA